MAGDDDFMEELRREFLEEASFLLEQCEESYLRLDRVGERAEELSKIFRAAHSMKGAGAAVGFADLAQFAHAVEDLLSLLRLYPELIEANVISVLLKTGDAFRNRIEMLKAKSAAPWEIAGLTEEVRGLTQELNGRTAGGSASSGNEEKLFEQLAQDTRASLTSGEIEPQAAQVPEAPAPGPDPAPGPAEPAAPTAVPTVAPMATPQGGAQSTGASSVKVDTDRIDSVLDLIGELVVIKSQLMNETAAYASNPQLNAVVSLLDKTVRELQGKALSMRMTALKPIFLKLQRIVRDTSLKVGKPIDFRMDGEETEIDRTMIELLADPLMHIVRNSVDHGVERPELRRQNGKPEKGSISVVARQVGGRVVVEIKDDGGGINKEKVFKKAVEKGLVAAGTTAESMKDSEVYALIFAPGFSTAEAVSDISGRGVGLDVVKSNIEKLKGSIEIESAPGTGTCFRISIPLTTSITDGMVTLIRGNRYIVPMDRIRELVHLRDARLTEVAPGRDIVEVRGRIFPLARLDGLDQVSEGGAGDADSDMIVVAENERSPFAFRVGAVLGQSQVVLKALGSSFRDNPVIAGAAIMGDGRVALVLDVDGIVERDAGIAGAA